jgi:hypothetical protein
MTYIDIVLNNTSIPLYNDPFNSACTNYLKGFINKNPLYAFNWSSIIYNIFFLSFILGIIIPQIKKRIKPEQTDVLKILSFITYVLELVFDMLIMIAFLIMLMINYPSVLNFFMHFRF